MTEPLHFPYVLSYSPLGYIQCVRTMGGATEVIGGPLDFTSGKHEFRRLRYLTSEANTREVEAQLQELRRPESCRAVRPVHFEDGAEALAFLEALAACYRQGDEQQFEGRWRGDARAMFAVVPPVPINASQLLRDSHGTLPIRSNYDW